MRITYFSFDGRYCDSPRVLYEALLARESGDEHVWLAHPAHRDGFPATARHMLAGSDDAVAALEDADLVISNNHLDLEWRKRPEATYLQTWHGTPLKRIHWDVLWAPQGRLERLSRDVARWDWLISPNAASTPLLAGAFRFGGEVLQVGYPRNDVLVGPDADAVRARTRKELAIEPDQLAVLYAPTWRDDVAFDPAAPEVTLGLDAEQVVTALGERVVVLQRLHYMVSERRRLRSHPQVRDVSNHPEIADLYLAADVLVTDYSSTMFDFAVTRKPIVFHVPDLAEYRDRLRGFYFDLVDLAPGPLLATTGEVTHALGDLPGVADEWAARYTRFRDRFCHLEDGHATERVLARVDGLR